MTKAEIAQRVEDLHWLDDNGCALDDALRQTGLSTKGLEKWCQRRGLAELFSRLRHRGHTCTHHCLRHIRARAQSPYTQGETGRIGSGPEGAETPESPALDQRSCVRGSASRG